MNITGDTLEDAVTELSRLKRWQPFRFSGVWYVAIINGNAVAYRKKKDLLQRAKKHGLETLSVATL